ncbi:hypothetical protein AB0M95_38480 [Sphaerisporangium sp. NPDC051017]|uniref:hypothetical protein n=1 Tax=Sphaerisporangium sp. NPDC051017 TaxID=3154636 RepID=UPI00342EF84A
MNGGAWLCVGGLAVDVLLRDAGFVEQTACEAREGRFSSNYLPGYPHGWQSFMLVSEIAHNVPLAGDEERLGKLRALAEPYPEPLRAAILDRFLYEAHFSALLLGKLAGRNDLAQEIGLAHRGVLCLVHALFALNRVYLVNEKGSLEVAAGFPDLPDGGAERITAVLTAATPERRAELLADLARETEALVRERMPSWSPSWNLSSFPTA